MEDKAHPERREFVKMAALAGATAVVTGVPLAAYLIAPVLQQERGRWVDFGALQELKLGSIEKLSYEFMVKDGWLVLPQRGFVWVKTATDGTLTIFSSRCTHLGCNVSWREEAGVFECPCHSGTFDANGQPRTGSPTRPLAALEHKVEDGCLKIFVTL